MVVQWYVSEHGEGSRPCSQMIFTWVLYCFLGCCNFRDLQEYGGQWNGVGSDSDVSFLLLWWVLQSEKVPRLQPLCCVSPQYSMPHGHGSQGLSQRRFSSGRPMVIAAVGRGGWGGGWSIDFIEE